MFHFCRKISLTTLIVSMLVLSGCGRLYYVKGKVVSLVGFEGTKSLIGEITKQTIPEEGKAVHKAKVRLIHQLDKNGKPIEDTVWQKTVETNEGGFFEIHDYATPGKQNLVGLEVKAPGFETAYTTYWDLIDEKPQVFYIILAPNNAEEIK